MAGGHALEEQALEEGQQAGRRVDQGRDPALGRLAVEYLRMLPVHHRFLGRLDTEGGQLDALFLGRGQDEGGQVQEEQGAKEAAQSLQEGAARQLRDRADAHRSQDRLAIGEQQAGATGEAARVETCQQIREIAFETQRLSGQGVAGPGQGQQRDRPFACPLPQAGEAMIIQQADEQGIVRQMGQGAGEGLGIDWADMAFLQEGENLLDRLGGHVVLNEEMNGAERHVSPVVVTLLPMVCVDAGDVQTCA